MIWLFCFGGVLLMVCIFTYSLCKVSYQADERLGLQEWQQGERNEPQKQ